MSVALKHQHAMHARIKSHVIDSFWLDIVQMCTLCVELCMSHWFIVKELALQCSTHMRQP